MAATKGTLASLEEERAWEPPPHARPPPPPDREPPGGWPEPRSFCSSEEGADQEGAQCHPPSPQTTQQQAVICCPAECLPLAGASSAELQLYKERRESQAGGWTGGGGSAPPGSGLLRRTVPAEGFLPAALGLGCLSRKGPESAVPHAAAAVAPEPQDAGRRQGEFHRLLLHPRFLSSVSDAGREGRTLELRAPRATGWLPGAAGGSPALPGGGGGKSREGWTEVAQLEGSTSWKIW